MLVAEAPPAAAATLASQTECMKMQLGPQISSSRVGFILMFDGAERVVGNWFQCGKKRESRSNWEYSLLCFEACCGCGAGYGNHDHAGEKARQCERNKFELIWLHLKFNKFSLHPSGRMHGGEEGAERWLLGAESEIFFSHGMVVLRTTHYEHYLLISFYQPDLIK